MRAGRIAALACAAALVAGCGLNSRTVVREIDDASKSVTSPLASVAQAGASCFDFFAAVMAFFHWRTQSKVSGDTRSATDRGC